MLCIVQYRLFELGMQTIPFLTVPLRHLTRLHLSCRFLMSSGARNTLLWWQVICHEKLETNIVCLRRFGTTRDCLFFTAQISLTLEVLRACKFISLDFYYGNDIKETSTNFIGQLIPETLEARFSSAIAAVHSLL